VNPNSKITARIYSPSKEGVDKGFFKRRIREAILRRGGYELRNESERLVFAEADFLPGLIIDRFVGWPLDALEAAIKERPLHFKDAEAALGPPSSWLVIQFLCWGMDERREMIIEALEELFPSIMVDGPEGEEPLSLPAGIMEKSTARVRELEGLPLREGLLRGILPPSGIVIFENDLPFVINLEESQKTGHFLDQRDNRRMAASYFAQYIDPGQAKVLDACAYTGGFGIHAARAGAGSVVCVDVSAPALNTLSQNAALNGVESRVKTEEADIFEYLRAAQRKKERYDFIILDPPAFTKTKASLDGAIRGYNEINLRAISLLKPGGILVSCSCSQAVSETLFRKIISDAAADSGRRLYQLDFRCQAKDHPILLGYEESHYLKCGFYLMKNKL
jgi:23S rRNA (cytosine1962-C5)-methyltransferase